jgi:hypothetical protein
MRLRIYRAPTRTASNGAQLWRTARARASHCSGTGRTDALRAIGPVGAALSCPPTRKETRTSKRCCSSSSSAPSVPRLAYSAGVAATCTATRRHTSRTKRVGDTSDVSRATSLFRKRSDAKTAGRKFSTFRGISKTVAPGHSEPIGVCAVKTELNVGLSFGRALTKRTATRVQRQCLHERTVMDTIGYKGQAIYSLARIGMSAISDRLRPPSSLCTSRRTGGGFRRRLMRSSSLMSCASSV